jgi:serine phosphatase RsbU (regulator of sigma subunit)
MEQSLLYQERDHIAQTLQRSLLPHRLPDLPGYEVAARYRAAGEGYDVGGDFYDMFETRGSAWAIVMGDVCGKGPEAASLTSLARYTVRTGAAMETLPSGVLQVTNEGIRRDRTDDRFLTAVYAHLDPATGALVTANAGHPPMLVLRADRTVEQVAPRGPVLGVIAGAAYVDERIELAPGDAIVMYTDGVLDAGAPDRLLRPAELARIASAHADGPAAELADAIERGALEAAAGAPRDDIAVLVLRRDPA